MNSLYIILAVILIILILYPKITISENQIYSPLLNTSKKESTPRMYDFYIPQLTGNQTPLSQDNFNNQTNANMLTRNTYLNDDNVDIIRSELSSIDKKYPKYILKDTLSGNTIGSSEMHSTDGDPDTPYKSFSDDNVSQYPKFYNSDIKNELTNIGTFFDKKNRYINTTHSNSSAYVDDNCYIDSNNDITCLDNTRLQNISPKDTNSYTTCGIIKDIGNYKLNESKDSVMNGLSFYDSVFASSKKNETFSPFIESSTIKECFVDV
jgi:hypothetical protein